MRGLQVFEEGLGPLVEEVVWRLVKPLAAVPVPVGLAAEGVATGALIKEVVKGVGRPAALAGQLIVGDVQSEATRVVQGERVTHR